MSPAELVSAVAAEYARHADAERAAQMRAYMRDRFPFFGIPAPLRRSLDRAVVQRSPGRPTHHYLVGVARACWAAEERELQYFAVDQLRRHRRRLEPAFLDVARELVTTRAWWDTVDALAAGVVGPLVRTHGLHEQMDVWIRDDDVWVARTALLHQLGAKGDTDVDRLLAHCLLRAEDEDVAIRKAIGWALRDLARTDPETVRRFVAANAGRLSALSRREALKHVG